MMGALERAGHRFSGGQVKPACSTGRHPGPTSACPKTTPSVIAVDSRHM
jgi:hypothetical protein